MMIHNSIKDFYDLKPAAFKFLKSVNFTRNISKNGCTDYEAEITLYDVNTNRQLKMHFSTVTDIQLGNIEGMFGLIIEIKNIKDRQIENASFRVTEEENDIFSFNCSDFYINADGYQKNSI